ncbi:uncharacterized mitochondrial protein AtMg00820-like [Aristolochia californica]|uniref:uncharacterized mitochondrial protein AtMg00820-like n=1 Tax=Aristolochia californica TaxID=171875 RepID=UPI0035E3B6C7
MEEELHALYESQTWVFVPLPLGKKLVGYKWVFTIKHIPDGYVACSIGRWAQVHMNKEGPHIQVDYYFEVLITYICYYLTLTYLFGPISRVLLRLGVKSIMFGCFKTIETLYIYIYPRLVNEKHLSSISTYESRFPGWDTMMEELITTYLLPPFIGIY